MISLTIEEVGLELINIFKNNYFAALAERYNIQNDQDAGTKETMSGIAHNRKSSLKGKEMDYQRATKISLQ